MPPHKRTLALICARGGSKGLPGKNLKVLAGRPLVAWAIHHAKSVGGIDRVVVSTDSEEIRSVARAAGGEVPFLRPPALAQDNSPEWLVWRHALGYLNDQEGYAPDVMIVVPATAPLRATEDLEACLGEYERGDADIVLTVAEARRSPYFSMVKVQADGYVSLVSPLEAHVSRRQDAPEVFDITPVAYVARPSFVMSAPNMFAGRVRHVRVPPERAIDIDTEFDFRIAECLMGETRPSSTESSGQREQRA